MKTYLKYIVFILFISVTIACNNKKKEKSDKPTIEKAETLEQLKEKYGNHKFENCDELIEAGDEIIDVYIETVNKAYNGDTLAKKDIDRFDSFMNQYDAMALKVSAECPERFEEWANKTEERISQVYPKIDKIYRSDFEVETFEYDEDLERQIDEEVKELNKQVQKALGDEDFSLKNK
ncbi:MAG: hypothetical protein PHE33_02865 [Bacteroidales bacterium]|nr:hypothetical protein [Bacteroidales bacterium]